MIDAKTDSQPKENQSVVDEFQKKITNGAVIPLGKKAHNGEVLEVVFRWQPSPIDPRKTTASVELFTRKENAIVPIGFNDWLIADEEAWAFGLMAADLSVNDEIAAAFAPIRIGNSASTLWVEDEYQNQGNGTFLVAASVAMLDKIGVKEARMMGLTEAGSKTGRHFGVSTNDVVSVGGLKAHPRTVSSIQQFTHPKI